LQPAWSGHFSVARVNGDPFKISDRNLMLDCNMETSSSRVPPSTKATSSTGSAAATAASAAGSSISGGSGLYPLSFVMSQEMYALRETDRFTLSLFVLPHRTAEETDWLRHQVPHQYGQWGELVDVRRIASSTGTVIQVHLVLSFGGNTCSLLIEETPELAAFLSYPPNVYLALDIVDFKTKLARLQKMS